MKNHAKAFYEMVKNGKMANSLDRVFPQIVAQRAVTGSEHRLYRWIIKDWVKSLAKDHPNVKERLTTKFLGGSQLLVSWNGYPKSKRQLVLIAHTDHEGYRITQCQPSEKASNTLLLEGMQVAMLEVEEWRKHERLRIVYEVDSKMREIGGAIVRIGNENGDKYMIAIEANAESDQINEILRVFKKTQDDPIGTPPIVAEYHLSNLGDNPVFTMENLPENKDTRIWHLQRPVEAPCIDNCAGVAIALVVLESLAKQDAQANLSVLFTTGEEAGFIGLHSLISDNDQEFKELLKHSICVVLDSSSVEHSIRTGVNDWYQRRIVLSNHKAGIQNTNEKVDIRLRCPSDVTSIRLEDWWSLYDANVGRFLYQAALGVQHNIDNELLTPEYLNWTRSIGVAGEFCGGVCEASLLSMYPELKQENNGEKAAPVRIGALAIPLANYRGEDGFNCRILPELSKTGALYSAALIALNAALILEHSYVPLASQPAIVRDSGLQKIPELQKELIDGLGLVEFLRKWVKTEGMDLIARC